MTDPWDWYIYLRLPYKSTEKEPHAIDVWYIHPHLADFLW